MYSCTCFLTIVALLVMDVRTGALQESDIHPTHCYNCHYNDTTSCEEPSSWATVTCPNNRPLCATILTIPDSHSSLVCAPVMKTSCTVRASFNSSVEVTWVCNSHLCNTPLRHKWRNELNTYTNITDMIQLNICELLSKYNNNTQQDIVSKYLDITEKPNAKRSSESTTLVPTSTLNMHLILRDSERPRAEPLKQEPTVPSDDDEDESEGSGTDEESRIRNHAVSAPAAPNSLLPANENGASVLYKDLLLTTLFINSYLLV